MDLLSMYFPRMGEQSTKFNAEERRANWDNYYREKALEDVPWYTSNLDPDLEKEIKTRNIVEGKFLDLGTGLGTQAAALANLGFETIASEISRYILEVGRKTFPKVKFVYDDILNSRFQTDEFNYIFDRGCVHTFSPEKHAAYLFHVNRILKQGGLLFVKTMSKDENGSHKGPSKFSEKDINDFFLQILM